MRRFEGEGSRGAGSCSNRPVRATVGWASARDHSYLAGTRGTKNAILQPYSGPERGAQRCSQAAGKSRPRGLQALATCYIALLVFVRAPRIPAARRAPACRDDVPAWASDKGCPKSAARPTPRSALAEPHAHGRAPPSHPSACCTSQQACSRGIHQLASTSRRTAPGCHAALGDSAPPAAPLADAPMHAASSDAP